MPAGAKTSERPPLSSSQAARLQEVTATVAAVTAASELGVFELLDQRRADPAELASVCGLTERGARALLAVLAALRLVERGDDGRYGAAVSDVAALAAVVGSWRAVVPALRGELRQGGDTTTGAELLYPGIVRQLGALFAESAQQAAAVLFEPGLRVLDVAAGAAPWSIALARRDPRCQVTAIELTKVLPETRRAVREAGLEPQYRLVAGDVFQHDLRASGNYDLLLAANLLHLFDDEANAGLVTRLAGALRRGGRIAVVDVVANEHLDGPRAAVLYGLGLLQRTTTGTIYPYSAYRRWLAQAGFERPRQRKIGAALPLTLITARLP
jgi:ubiquinone/menaquinone biosynthesis C-methylase UbiE